MRNQDLKILSDMKFKFMRVFGINYLRLRFGWPSAACGDERGQRYFPCLVLMHQDAHEALEENREPIKWEQCCYVAKSNSGWEDMS